MGYAVYRRDGGVNAIIRAYTDDGGTFFDAGGLYLEGRDDCRFCIVHELGHAIGYFRDNLDEPACDDGSSSTACYDANQNGCHHIIGDFEEMQEKEYQSGAAKEGWAHFYPAVAFNSTAQTDCAIVYFEDQDYDLDGVVESPANTKLDCEAGPSVVMAKDYYTEMCVPLPGIDENRGVNLDWLRFWWDFMTEEAAVEFSDCIDIYDAANPRSWNITGDVQDSCSSLTDACNPADRFLLAAHNHLANDADWDDHLDNGNGR